MRGNGVVMVGWNTITRLFWNHFVGSKCVSSPLPVFLFWFVVSQAMNFYINNHPKVGIPPSQSAKKVTKPKGRRTKIHHFSPRKNDQVGVSHARLLLTVDPHPARLGPCLGSEPFDDRCRCRCSRDGRGSEDHDQNVSEDEWARAPQFEKRIRKISEVQWSRQFFGNGMRCWMKYGKAWKTTQDSLFNEQKGPFRPVDWFVRSWILLKLCAEALTWHVSFVVTQWIPIENTWTMTSMSFVAKQNNQIAKTLALGSYRSPFLTRLPLYFPWQPWQSKTMRRRRASARPFLGVSRRNS